MRLKTHSKVVDDLSYEAPVRRILSELFLLNIELRQVLRGLPGKIKNYFMDNLTILSLIFYNI